MRTRVGVAIVVLALVALTAGAAGAADGRVNILCSPDPAWCEAMKREFGKATGIQAEFVRLSSGAGLARIRAEKGSPTFDVWFGGSGDSHWVAQAEGLLEFFRPKAWGELRPQLTRAVDGHYIPLYTGLHGFGVNEKLLREKSLPVPETWKELGDPKYKGLVAMPNPNTSGTGYVMMATVVQVYGEDGGFELLKAIHKNVAQYTKSGSAPAEMVARGEYAAAITWDQAVMSRVQKGFPIEFIIPSEGTPLDLDTIVIFKSAKNVEAAKKVVDFVGSERGMRAAAKLRSKVTRPGIPGLVTIEPKLMNYDFDWAGTNQERIMKAWKDKFGK